MAKPPIVRGARWLAPVALAAALLSFGCGGKKKVQECNDLVGVINAGVDKIQKGTSKAPDGGAAVGELRALAEEMDGIGKDAAKVQLTLPELQKLSKDYQAMVTEVATAARELAGAVDNVDVEKMSKAQTRMEQAVKREDPVVESINNFCRTP
jgi:methyl-accepting chemotaxis protein